MFYHVFVIDVRRKSVIDFTLAHSLETAILIRDKFIEEYGGQDVKVILTVELDNLV